MLYISMNYLLLQILYWIQNLLTLFCHYGSIYWLVLYLYASDSFHSFLKKLPTVLLISNRFHLHWVVLHSSSNTPPMTLHYNIPETNINYYQSNWYLVVLQYDYYSIISIWLFLSLFSLILINFSLYSPLIELSFYQLSWQPPI